MTEHADQYWRGEGRKQKDFVREAPDVFKDLPGDQPGTADAIATLVDQNGHWLGGRLHVERVVAELRPLIAEAAKIRPPGYPADAPFPF